MDGLVLRPLFAFRDSYGVRLVTATAARGHDSVSDSGGSYVWSSSAKSRDSRFGPTQTRTDAWSSLLRGCGSDSVQFCLWSRDRIWLWTLVVVLGFDTRRIPSGAGC